MPLRALQHVLVLTDDLETTRAFYDALVARLEARGVRTVSNDVPGAGIRQLFLDDPNGVRIELNVG